MCGHMLPNNLKTPVAVNNIPNNIFFLMKELSQQYIRI